MAETSGISKSATTIVASNTRNSYKEARGVATRAELFADPDSTAIHRALDRLRNRLTSGEPLRTDTPRGYYFNIVV